MKARKPFSLIIALLLCALLCACVCGCVEDDSSKNNGETTNPDATWNIQMKTPVTMADPTPIPTTAAPTNP